MTSLFRAFVFLCACAVLSSCASSSGDPIEVRKAWSPAMPPGSTAAAAYVDIVANQADTLLGVSTPVAETVEMHETLEQDGMMQMRPLAELRMSAGQQVRFEPGGKHIMLSGVRQVLPVGTQFPLTLRFALAGDIAVRVEVVSPGTAP